MKKLKIGLLGKILIAIALGIGVGLIAQPWMVRTMLTFNGIFSQFLGFAIPLIILGLVTPAISDIGKTAGKMLLITVAIAYGSTVIAGLISYLTGAPLFPGMIRSGAPLETLGTADELAPFFTVNIPPVMGVMTALVLSFTLGLGLAYIERQTLKDAVHDFEQVIIKTIKSAIIPLLPLYIFGIFLNMTYVGQVFSILTVFIKIIGIIFVIHIGILIIQFVIAGGLTKKNPFRLLWNMLPAYFTGFSICSSAASIPMTLESTLRNGVSKDVAGFVIPLCANVHMVGSAVKLCSSAVAIAWMSDMSISAGQFTHFIFMLGIAAVAAPGVTGGVLMASLGLVDSILGFSAAQATLLMTFYLAIDGYGPAANVTGDGAIALVIERFFGKRGRSAAKSPVTDAKEGEMK